MSKVNLPAGFQLVDLPLQWDMSSDTFVVDLTPATAVDSYRSRTISDREALSLYYSNLGVILSRAGRPDAAKRVYLTALSLDRHAETQICPGDYKRVTRNLEQARQYSSTSDLWCYERLSSELKTATHRG